MREQAFIYKNNTNWPQRLFNILIAIIFISIVFGILMLMGLTMFMQDAFCQSEVIFIKQIICWLDPVFTIYNLALLLLIVMVVPVITFFYVRTMRERKKHSLWQQIPDDEINSKKIDYYLEETFRLNHYAGSMTLLSVIILLGGMIILILKPIPIADVSLNNGFGVDYSKGVNFLMLGSYMHYFIEGSLCDYMRVMVATLTAFQFGFLGAYVYFITHLVRSYFTLDLSPNIYFSCSVRIMLGTILSLILSFFLISDNYKEEGISKTGQAICQIAEQVVIENNIDAQDQSQAVQRMTEAGLIMSKSYYYLPIISFFIGFFPLRGLLLIERIAGGLLQILPVKYQSTSLTNLLGMSFQHEIRLKREGFDNVENFVNADIIDLAIRSGFFYQQLEKWRSQATLITHLGDDYADFRQKTSINSVDELQKNKDWFSSDTNNGVLANIIDEALYQKTRIILNTILETEKQKES